MAKQKSYLLIAFFCCLPLMNTGWAKSGITYKVTFANSTPFSLYFKVQEPNCTINPQDFNFTLLPGETQQIPWKTFYNDSDNCQGGGSNSVISLSYFLDAQFTKKVGWATLRSSAQGDHPDIAYNKKPNNNYQKSMNITSGHTDNQNAYLYITPSN